MLSVFKGCGYAMVLKGCGYGIKRDVVMLWVLKGCGYGI